MHPASGDFPPRDLVAIFHASFHRTQGSIIDWSLKADQDLDLSNVEFSCLPSGLHLVESDVIYFNKGNHQGVCVFRRRRTTEDGHRGFRLSSLGILLASSPRPRPWKHVSALKDLVNSIYSSLEDRDTLEPVEGDWDPARTFFEERKVRPDSGSSRTWGGWPAELGGPLSEHSPTLHLPHLLRILGPSSLTLYKHILGRRRILIVTKPPVEAACILCQVAADTCYQEQVSELVSRYAADSSEDEEESPRRLKGKNTAGVKVLGMVTLNDLDKLEFESKSGRGWVACTTDSIYLDKPQFYDLIIDLRSATPNNRPAFYVRKAVEQPTGRTPAYRLSSVRFTWSDVRLWTELDRVLQFDSEDSPDPCCDPSHTHKPRNSTSSAWTDVWRVYEDVCVICAGLWMGAWRSSPPRSSSSSCSGSPQRAENWGSIRLEGDDELGSSSQTSVRPLGAGIEGRPPGGTLPPSGRTSRALRRASNMSVWTWTGAKGDVQTSTSTHSQTQTQTHLRSLTYNAPAPTDGMFIPGAREREREGSKDPAEVEVEAAAAPEDEDVVGEIEGLTAARHERQVMTTLALLNAFHANTTTVLSRLGTLLESRRDQRRADMGSVTVSTGTKGNRASMVH